MQRVVIIGSSGAGKSTLARTLGATLNLPVIHLDKYYWHPGWVETPHSAWQTQVRELVDSDRWIIDGNYRGTLNIRLAAADTIIFLDPPRWLCAWRILKRRVQYHNRPRPDMAPGCREKIFDLSTLEFLYHVWDYPNRARPDIVRRLKKLEHHQQVVQLHSATEVDQFLNNPHAYTSGVRLVHQNGSESS